MDSDLLFFAIIFGMLVGIACSSTGYFIANIIIRTTDLYKERQKTLEMLLLLKNVKDAIKKDK